MRVLKAVSAAILATSALASPAMALTFVGSYTIDANTSDPGLAVVVDADSATAGNQKTGALNFSLAKGETKSVDLFTIWTNESDVDWARCPAGDTCKKPLNLALDFGALGLNADLTGLTWGSSVVVAEWANLSWFDKEQTFNFGKGGVLGVSLNNVTFGKGAFGLSDRPAQVTAEFTLISAPVPEPANWAMMIVGFGMAGGMLRARRSSTKASFA